MTPGSDRVFHYRPAPLRPKQEVRLDGSQLRIAGDGPRDLATVSHAAFEDRAFGDSRMVRLTLGWPDAHCALGCNGGRRSFNDNADAQGHRAAVVAVLRALAAAQPEAQVILGAGRGTRRIFLAIGIVALLAGAGIAVGAVAGGVSGERLLGAAMPVLLLVLIGAGLTASHWPRPAPRVVGATALANALEAAA